MKYERTSLFMGANPFLSVIAPLYNAEKYITNCLDSILNQDFSDFEVFCLYSNLDKEISECINSYREKDVRIKVISCDESNYQDMTNEMVAKASGEYIVFYDSAAKTVSSCVLFYFLYVFL